jgi:phosphate transport system permease protein
MRVMVRTILDKAFTALSALSVLLLCLVLVLILGPMTWRGLGAIVFRGTVEFRKMQLAEFEHGNEAKIQAEAVETEAARKYVYEMIDTFKRGIDTEELTEKVRKIHRDFGAELRYKQTPRQQYTELRSITRDIRDRLEVAFASQDRRQIVEHIEYVLQYEQDERFNGTMVDGFFELAREFQQAVADIDLRKRHEYEQDLAEVEQILFGSGEQPGLLGPRPDEPLPVLAMNRYGATRWDVAQSLLDRLLWREEWVQKEPDEPQVKVRTSRVERFAGTKLEPLFSYVEQNLDKMLKPRWTFYWRYFVDDSTPGHYFGGIGPEIVGTVVLTVLSMLFVVPLGVISAAYLVECASDSLAVRIIRTCINTLAGVPSIVFGLFGLAFFVLYFLPLFGAPSKPCILAGSLTLAVLTLPVMIRASEEAIRSVPQTYKEASLALGASRFRSFVTVTLPAALPGILTGIILSLSRVAGETAPLLFTAAVAVGPIPRSLFSTTRTLSYGSWDMAVGDRLSALVPHNQYGMVVTLVTLVLCLNGLAIIVRARVFRRLKGQ